ncbi:MAG: transcription antitermination protein NusB [Bacilli bacterium]|nr:transcription antitermination protein NusB [Bacilli bacterium]MBN2696585.1 transcription antitermination protein NusB [Bacilli bacterium]
MSDMKPREIREQLVKLIYTYSVDGHYDLDAYPSIVRERFSDVILRLEAIDNIIVRCLTNWTIDRLNYVDKAIVRYAVYEMKYLDLPFEIAIDEALELTKIYSNLDDNLAKNFNNKLLDTIKDHLDD